MPIPNPEPGLVISYSYLWHFQRQAGHEEGQKTRPSVIVLASTRADDATIVTVLPITHTRPQDLVSAVEIPMPVKRHLGLDDQPSWIIVTEGNKFLWPGYDLHKLPGSDRYEYGFLPPRFFDQVVRAFMDCHRTGRLRQTVRD
jgi:hypothetical protein